MSAQYHFYDKQTGMLHETSIVVNFGKDNDLIASVNCPAGHKPIAGKYDRLSQKVDVTTTKVVDYQPPQPSPDHEWNATSKRWQLMAAAQSKVNADKQARERIAQIEGGSFRALRELALGVPGSQARLKAADDEIATLRKDLLP